jgi:osmoprotectant transport system permease protein
VSEQLALLPQYLSAHVRLSLAALAAGIALAVPAGVVVSRTRSLEAPLLGLAGVIQTIPALALLAVMVPLLSGLGLPGIGVLPAFLGLVLYSLLPILRNTVTGLHGVDPAVVEAARGVGMTPRERLRRVELPLALPVIVAGIRTATVWTVGMATLSTPVGAPSLGNYIFGGLQTLNSAAVLVGCAAAALLALALDFLVRTVGAALAQRRRGPLAAALCGLLVLGAWAWAADRGPARGTALPPVRVGAKTFTEQFILADVLAGVVRLQTGRSAVTLTSLGSTVAFDALVRDEIDLYVDYTGTLWSTVMGHSGRGGSRDEVLANVRTWLESRGITLVAALGFENAYCLAVRRETATALRLETVSDLVPHAPRLTLTSDYEFFAREEWRSLERVYGLAFRARRSMDPSLLYQAIATRQVDVITAYSSDGRIEALSLVTLVDDRNAIPPYDAVVLAGPRLSREAPDVLAAVARLEGAIDVARMRDLNQMVDEGGKSPSAAAAAFLASWQGKGGVASKAPP